MYVSDASVGRDANKLIGIGKELQFLRIAKELHFIFFELQLHL